MKSREQVEQEAIAQARAFNARRADASAIWDEVDKLHAANKKRAQAVLDDIVKRARRP